MTVRVVGRLAHGGVGRREGALRGAGAGGRWWRAGYPRRAPAGASARDA